MPAESDSSLPLPGIPPTHFRSSPPPFEPKYPFEAEEMDNDAPTHKSESASPSQQPPLRRAESTETERPPSAQQVTAATNESANAGEDSDEETSESDPAEKIADFDWVDLHQRYHNAVNQCSHSEEELMQEWHQLMDFFSIWAEAGKDHESDRTYKRLRTRMAYTENVEAKLEKTRMHYINVVKAFESALNLLKSAGFPG